MYKLELSYNKTEQKTTKNVYKNGNRQLGIIQKTSEVNCKVFKNKFSQAWNLGMIKKNVLKKPVGKTGSGLERLAQSCVAYASGEVMAELTD